MADLETLKGLLARVRAAGAPDQDLDRAIGAAFPPPGGWYDEEFIPAYTGDADAIIELAERFLPPIKAFVAGSPPSSGWKLNFYRGMTPTGQPHSLWQVNIREHALNGFDGDAATLPLAVLDALLQALIAQAEQGGSHGE